MERRTFIRNRREEVLRRIEEARKNREEATKKYVEEMASYFISLMERDIQTICCSNNLPHANENKHPLVFSIPDLCSPDRSILDVSTKDFHTISSPHFQDALCLYNKGEWLLMCHKEEVSLENYHNSLFLLNHASGIRINLPRPYEKGHFAFNLTCESPCHVVHCTWKSSTGNVVIEAISPSDSAWEVYELRSSHKDVVISSVFVIEELVMCIDHKGGRIMTFDLSACSWTLLSERKKFPDDSQCFFIEQDTEVMCVSSPTRSHDFFRFYKFDWQSMDWVLINNIELMNTSWFLGQPCSFYMKGGKGNYVYSLKSFENWGGQPGVRPRPGYGSYFYSQMGGENFPVNIFIHNMVSSSIENLLPYRYQSKKPALWVDGRIMHNKAC